MGKKIKNKKCANRFGLLPKLYCDLVFLAKELYCNLAIVLQERGLEKKNYCNCIAREGQLYCNMG